MIQNILIQPKVLLNIIQREFMICQFLKVQSLELSGALLRGIKPIMVHQRFDFALLFLNKLLIKQRNGFLYV